jgi:mannosylfructose-phosphate synthase
MVYQSSTAVVATTPAQLEILRAEYDVDFDRVLIWPAGYDDNRFYPVGDASRDLLRARFSFQRRTVLSLGRLARNKGYDLLVRAFAVCARRIPDAELVIAAGGESRNPAEAALLAELKSEISACGVEDRVRLLDYIPDEELADLYRAADLFAMPSRYEPFGMTAIEAMACGTPTVATIHGGLFRLLHFGVDSLFADPFDAEDFGITMVKPLRHPKLWDRMANNGATLARTLFTWSGVAQQVLNAVRSPSHFGRGLRVQEDSVGRSPEPSAEREAGE